MAEPELVQRAKQGEAAAIALLLARALQKQGISVTATLKEACLTINLHSSRLIDQEATIALIRQGMGRLQPANIRSVVVNAEASLDESFGWIESFVLDGNPSASAISNSDAAATAQSDSGLEQRFPLRSVEDGHSPRHSLSYKSPNHKQSSATPSPQLQSPNHKSPQLQSIKLQPKHISTAGVGALLTGLVLAIVLFSVGLLNTLFRGFLVLVHEVGHAITHWLFGRPAIPTVNILYGGGITLTGGQIGLLVIAVYTGVGYLAYHCRAYPRVLGAIGILMVVYSYCLLTPTNLMLSIFMGHGMELVAIVLCLYFSATGHLCRIKGDRAIYAMLGFFTLFNDIQFCWRLMRDAEFRAWYEGGIGGMIDNDFVILATQYFGVDLAAIAQFFLFCCLLSPAIAFLLCRYESWCSWGVRQLFKPV